MFDEDFSVNRRKWHRENTRLPAQYFIKKQSSRYQDCLVINISRSGAGVLFPPEEQLYKGTSVFLDVVVPKTFEQLTLRGEFVRIYKQGNAVFGGIHFESLLPEMMIAKLIIR